MASSVAMMIGALILPVTGNLVIILSSNKLLSTLGYFTYFLGMNVVMFALVRFTFKYCRLRAPREWIHRAISSVPGITSNISSIEQFRAEQILTRVSVFTLSPRFNLLMV